MRTCWTSRLAGPRSSLKLLDLQAALLKSVATGGPRINEVNVQYQQRRRALNAGLRRHRIEPPFPWQDLWGWHGTWKAVSGTYEGRRDHISGLAAPAYARLKQLIAGTAATDPGSAMATWPDLEERLAGLHSELQAAASLDDFQDVGRRAREILIDLAGLVYKPDMLPAGESEQPKGGDAKNRLAFAARVLMPSSGRSHEQWRALIRSAWDLANSITHSSGVSRIEAFAAVQVAVLLVRCFEQASADAKVTSHSQADDW